MKTSGRCPKCLSEDVHVISLDWRPGSSLPVGIMSAAQVDHYVCAGCGFVEEYVKDADARRAIAEKWPRTKG